MDAHTAGRLGPDQPRADDEDAAAAADPRDRERSRHPSPSALCDRPSAGARRALRRAGHGSAPAARNTARHPYARDDRLHTSARLGRAPAARRADGPRRHPRSDVHDRLLRPGDDPCRGRDSDCREARPAGLADHLASGCERHRPAAHGAIHGWCASAARGRGQTGRRIVLARGLDHGAQPTAIAIVALRGTTRGRVSGLVARPSTRRVR